MPCRQVVISVALFALLGWADVLPAAEPAPGNWIQNDLAAAQAEARKTGKPIFVTIRCER